MQICRYMLKFNQLPLIYRNGLLESRDFFNKRPKPAFYQRNSKCLATHELSALGLREDRGLEAVKKVRI
jgi:hypothetical protein